MALACGAALVLAFFLSKPIRAYQLGEVYAQNMGVHLRAFRHGADLALERPVRLRDGVRRAHFLCRHRRARTS